jgi:hypothetical protein
MKHLSSFQKIMPTLILSSDFETGTETVPFAHS